MIGDALVVMVSGMLGIFLTMGLIFSAIAILNAAFNKKKKNK